MLHQQCSALAQAGRALLGRLHACLQLALIHTAMRSVGVSFACSSVQGSAAFTWLPGLLLGARRQKLGLATGPVRLRRHCTPNCVSAGPWGIARDGLCALLCRALQLPLCGLDRLLCFARLLLSVLERCFGLPQRIKRGGALRATRA